MAPKIIKKLPRKTIPQEKPIKLEVKATGQPMPEIKWYKESEEIVPSEEYQIETFDDGTSFLIINEVYPDDSGEITCEASNSIGRATTKTIMHITEGYFYFICYITFFLFILEIERVILQLRISALQYTL